MSAENVTHLTEKQQYWLDHIQQAEASGQSLRQYAQQQALSLKALYQYRWLLVSDQLRPKYHNSRVCYS